MDGEKENPEAKNTTINKKHNYQRNTAVTIGRQPILDNTRTMRKFLQKRRLQKGNDAQTPPSPVQPPKVRTWIFTLKIKSEQNSEQCLHQGNDAKNDAIARYNQSRSDLGFSPRNSRLGTQEVPSNNQSHLMLSPPLASIPIAAYAHGSGGERWSCRHEQADVTR